LKGFFPRFAFDVLNLKSLLTHDSNPACGWHYQVFFLPAILCWPFGLRIIELLHDLFAASNHEVQIMTSV